MSDPQVRHSNVSSETGEAGQCVAGDMQPGSSEAGENVAVSQTAPEQPKRGYNAYPWREIELAITSGQMDFKEAAEHFQTPENSIRKRAKRKGWLVGQKAIAKIVQRQIASTVEASTSAITAAEIEKHKRTVFDTMKKSLEMFKAKSPRSFREAETADKMARRSAGLQDDQTQVGVLLQLNEAINTHEPEAREPIEAELVPLESDSDALSLEA